MRRLLTTVSLLSAVSFSWSLAAQNPDEINARFESMRAYKRFGNEMFGGRDPLMSVMRARSAAPDARAPKDARSKFDKGNKLLDRGDFKKAAEQFEAAIHSYPGYASAHNNLGVAALQLGEMERAQAGFETAAKLDPQLSGAQVNLGVLRIQQQKFGEAEAPLRTASRLDPRNLKALTLLAYVEALNKKYEDAIATGRRVHAFPQHTPYAFAHMVTATALQSAGRIEEAVAEYSQFLKEDPENPRAAIARQEMQKLQKGMVTNPK